MRKIESSDYPVIRRLRALRYPYRAIADVFGVSANRIFEICRDHHYNKEDAIDPAMVANLIKGAQ